MNTTMENFPENDVKSENTSIMLNHFDHPSQLVNLSLENDPNIKTQNLLLQRR